MKQKIPLSSHISLFSDYLFYAGFSFAPQTEHFPSAVIIGCFSTSFLQSQHFKIFTSSIESLLSGV
jgi:hypothetical protein